MSHTTSPPSIRIYDSASRHGRYSLPRRTPSSHSSTSAAPMPIPHARGDSPPPPLPPPRYISGLDSAPELTSWHLDSPRSSDAGHAAAAAAAAVAAAAAASGALRSGVALLAGSRASRDGSGDDTDSLDIRSSRRHSSSATTHTVDTDFNGDADMSDDDRSGPKRPSGANRRLQSESQLGQRSLHHNSNAYDKQLLAKIGGPNSAGPGPRPAGSAFLSPTSSHEPPPGARSPRDRFGELKPLSMPGKRHNSVDSGSGSSSSNNNPNNNSGSNNNNNNTGSNTRWTSAPSSGVSPGASAFRSPFDASSEYSWRRQNSASTPDTSTSTFADSATARSRAGPDDNVDFMDHAFAMDNESGMRDLHLGERGQAGGAEDLHLGSGAPLKRRAPSPPGEPSREDRSSVGNDLYHRRSAQMLNSRSSPVSRYQPVDGSASSVSSLGPKTGSLASSNMSWNHSMASSMTSYGDRLSPSALSPALETEYGPVSPYGASRSLNPSPRSAAAKVPHQRNYSENEPPHSWNPASEAAARSRQNSASNPKIQGHFICECCPKKPKKFETAQELRAHEQEKQYQCQYCPNRFKNKNEAERHQNSLHLRRHSWSCAALTGVHAAFHPNGPPPALADVCGYCGEEFANPPDWEARGEHLNHVHKFGECNQAKKFFRADHFRQHLKHSHAGASGKWTNMLENACMKDEPPPQPLQPLGAGMGSSGSPAPSPAGVAATSSGGAPSTIPDVINEVHDES